MLNNFFTTTEELNSTKRKKLMKIISAASKYEICVSIKEYLYLLLEYKLNLLLQATGEDAISIRGEIKNIKHFIAVLDKGDAP